VYTDSLLICHAQVFSCGNNAVGTYYRLHNINSEKMFFYFILIARVKTWFNTKYVYYITCRIV